MQKPLVFISHITEEKEIAIALKALIKATFLNMIEVFVSTDPASIKVGKRWLETITDALKSCKVEIILSSPGSVIRPWINFEAGAGWIRNISVIPLCHSGMTPEKLPAPLSALQSAIASSEPSMKMVFGVLAEVVGSTTPEVDFREFISAVNRFEETSRQIKAMTAITPITETDGLSSHELAALSEIAELTYTPGASVEAHKLRDRLQKAGLTGVAVVLALKMLSRKDFIEASTASDWNNNDFPVISITDTGWAWLEANQDKLKLVRDVPIQTANASEPEQEFKEGDIPF